LRTRTTKLLGVVISTITNPIFTRIVSTIEEKAHQAGYEVILAHTENNPAREETVIRRLLARRRRRVAGKAERAQAHAPALD